MVRRLGMKTAMRETRESNASDAVGVHDPTRVKAMLGVRPRFTGTSYVTRGPYTPKRSAGCRAGT
jgi:hypothetical protein